MTLTPYRTQWRWLTLENTTPDYLQDLPFDRQARLRYGPEAFRWCRLETF